MNGRSCLGLVGILVVAGMGACADEGAEPAVATGALTRVNSFGSNPGNLAMYAYAPAQPVAQAPLVVALHGCTQNASNYDNETGWTELAEEHGFYLVLPEQSSGNNSSRCFNWFQLGDITRGQGEASSIKSMVDDMIATYDIDPSRVYVTGLSAGGYMTSVMLATYPDVFAGGAVVAGGPYRCASGLIDAFGCMNGNNGRSPSQWASLVTNASNHQGPWPRVSIWHGTSDYTVSNQNQTELVEQWTAVHGIDATADTIDTVKGFPHRTYEGDGEVLVESYELTGMGHGTPIDPGSAPDQCGQPGAYILDVGICSSYFISEFWGVLDGTSGSTSTSTSSSSNSSTTSGAGGAGTTSSSSSSTTTSGSGGSGGSGGEPPTGPYCGSATNLDHFEAGRAIRLGNVPYESYSATGSYQWLGYDDETTTLLEQSPNHFVEVTSCP